MLRCAVQGFPTLKLFRGSDSGPSDYTGGRSADDLYAFMTRQAQPAFSQLSSDEDAAAFFAAGPAASARVVGLFSGREGDEQAAFKEAAEQLRADYSFALTDDAALLKPWAAEATAPSVLVVKQGEAAASHSGPFTAAAIAGFVRTEGFPVVGDIGPENFQQYVDRGLPIAWVFFDPNAPDLEAQLQHVRQAAAGVKGQLSVVKLDGVKCQRPRG